MLKDTNAWLEWQKKNTDMYGRQCLRVAQRVMMKLDALKEGIGIDAYKLVRETLEELEVKEFTESFAGCVAQMVSDCHARGWDFRIAFESIFKTPSKDKKDWLWDEIRNIGIPIKKTE